MAEFKILAHIIDSMEANGVTSQVVKFTHAKVLHSNHSYYFKSVYQLKPCTEST